MNFFRQNAKIILVILDGALLCALVLFFIYTLRAERTSSLYETFPAITPTHSLTATSSQQAIDVGLSLAPASSSTATPKKTIPQSTYQGCALNLVFAIIGGNPQSAGTINYMLTASNVGTESCLSASISLYYADGESFVSAVPNPISGYYWQFGTLAPGETHTLALVAYRIAPTQSGMTDEACLSADNGADACANSSFNPPAARETSVPKIQPAASASLMLAPQSGKELGVWVWTSLDAMSTSTMQKVIDEAVSNNFNAIYVTIDEYLTIAAISDDATRQAKLQSYVQDVTEFLTLAAQKNLSVDAEAGWRDWGEPQNQWKASKIMAFVAAYNQSHNVSFRGVQYDVEPYLLPTYNDTASQVLANYIQLVDAIANQAKSDNLPLTIVVPHFYDDAIQWAPEITADGVTTYPYNHILRILSSLQNGRIIVMAYRNFASGPDGSIDLANTEIHEADATNVHVLVAQETGSVMPSYVTFYGMTKAQLAAQISSVNQAFDPDSSFGGISIDYLDPFLNLQ